MGTGQNSHCYYLRSHSKETWKVEAAQLCPTLCDPINPWKRGGRDQTTQWARSGHVACMRPGHSSSGLCVQLMCNVLLQLLRVSQFSSVQLLSHV